MFLAYESSFSKGNYRNDVSAFKWAPLGSPALVWSSRGVQVPACFEFGFHLFRGSVGGGIRVL